MCIFFFGAVRDFQSEVSNLYFWKILIIISSNISSPLFIFLFLFGFLFYRFDIPIYTLHFTQVFINGFHPFKLLDVFWESFLIWYSCSVICSFSVLSTFWSGLTIFSIQFFFIFHSEYIHLVFHCNCQFLLHITSIILNISWNIYYAYLKLQLFYMTT